MVNLKSRVAWALKKAGKSNNELGEVFGVTSNTIAAYKDERGDLKGVVLSGLAEKFGFNAAWLLTGQGEPYGEHQPPQETKVKSVQDGRAPYPYIKEGDVQIPQHAEPDPREFDFVPMAEASLNAGGGAFVISEATRELYAFRKTWLRKIASSPRDIVLIEVSGDSMEPTVQNGDVVMLDLGRRALKSGLIYAIRIAETILIKRLDILAGGNVRVISDNRLYQPYEVPHRDLRIIGQVIWFARQLVRGE